MEGKVDSETSSCSEACFFGKVSVSIRPSLSSGLRLSSKVPGGCTGS